MVDTEVGFIFLQITVQVGRHSTTALIMKMFVQYQSKKTIFLLVLTTVFFFQPSMEKIGLYNTSVRTFAFKGNNIFVGTWGAGIYVSTDNGKNWSEANIGLNTMVEKLIYSLAVSDNYIFAGTYWSRIFYQLTTERVGKQLIMGCLARR